MKWRIWRNNDTWAAPELFSIQLLWVCCVCVFLPYTRISKRSPTEVAVLKSTQLINCPWVRRNCWHATCSLGACLLFGGGEKRLFSKGIPGKIFWIHVGKETRLSDSVLCVLLGFFLSKLQLLEVILTGGLPAPGLVLAEHAALLQLIASFVLIDLVGEILFFPLFIYFSPFVS